MLSYQALFHSVEDVWVIWLVSCVLFVIVTKRLFREFRGWQLSRIVRDERGASYSLSLVLVVPFYALLIATIVECTLMLTVKVGTTYAAYAAARAAVVWLPANDIPDANRRGMVHLAAVNALFPYASGSREHIAGGGGAFRDAPQAAGTAILAYRRYSGGRAPTDYLHRKWRYAAKATRMRVERSGDFERAVTVTVEYEMPLNTPGVGRFLGCRASWSGARFFTRRIKSTATLEEEVPKSDDRTLGIDYYENHGFRAGSRPLGVSPQRPPSPSVRPPSSSLPPLLRTGASRRDSIVNGTPGRIQVAETESDAGKKPAWYELRSVGRDAVQQHGSTIDRIAAEEGVDANLLKAIMYAENARGWYDGIHPRPNSLRPMNVHAEYWKDLGWTRDELHDPEVNIRAAAIIVKGIVDRLENPTVEKVATLYNSLSKDKVSEFGKRVGVIYRERLWERK